MIMMALWMYTTLVNLDFIAIWKTASAFSVSLMSLTAAVPNRGLNRESGAFLMELTFILLLTYVTVYRTAVVVALASAETESKVLYVYIDSTIHQKEDVSAVYCWGTLSMPTSVSKTSVH